MSIAKDEGHGTFSWQSHSASNSMLKKRGGGHANVSQTTGLHLQMQGVQVQSLVGEI